MPHTSDNDKKAQDNNALRHEKNMMREKQRIYPLMFNLLITGKCEKYIAFRIFL